MALLGATSLTGCNSIPQFIAGTADVGASASRTVFRMATSPVSWTKDTTSFDGTLRVINGSTSPGGSTNFPIVFTTSFPVSVTLDQGSVSLSVSQTQAFPNATNTGSDGTGTTDSTTLSTATISGHSHSYVGPTPGTATAAVPGNSGIPDATETVDSGTYGSGQSHTHTWQGHTHALGTISQHTHTISGQHSHTISSTQNFNVNYVDMIISIKD